MSKPRIETDADRAAREGATKQIGKDAHGKPVYALDLIDPQGNLVEAPISSALKPGWRYATDADRDAKAELERRRQPAPSTNEEKSEEPTPEA